MLRSFEPLQKIGTEMSATSTQRALLADLVVEWRAAKAERDVLDFADQIRLAGEIVERFPDVVADLRARYAVVLLDEYQDTSIAQRVLLQRIFGAGHPVMAVGDPCQAIYGWRGASVDNIEDFPEHFPAAGDDAAAARFTLSQNRRSGVSILEVANRTSAHLRTVHAGVEPLTAGANGKGQGAVTCALFETYAQETEWVVGEIEATHAARGTGRSVAWSDIAVLAATGADLVAVDSALRRRGIPTQLVGAAALMAQPAVIDLRSMLEVVHDPSANPAFVRLAVGPRWRIGARDLAALGDRAAHLAGGRHRSGQDDIGSALDDAVAGTDIVESISLTEALDDLGDLDRYSAEAVERFGAMARELRALRGHVGEPLPEFVLRVLRVTGLEVEAALGSPESAAQQQHALHAFLDLAAEFTELDGRLTLGAFLARLRDAERFDIDLELDVAGPADAVQLLTVHKAKGLEFAYVFVPFVAAGRLPRRARAVAVADQRQHRAVAAARRLHGRPGLVPRGGRGPAGQALRRVQEGPRRAHRAGEPAAGVRGLHPRRAGPRRVGALVGSDPVDPPRPRRLPVDRAPGVPRRVRAGRALGTGARRGRRQPPGPGRVDAAGLAAGSGPRPPGAPARGRCRRGGGAGDAAGAARGRRRRPRSLARRQPNARASRTGTSSPRPCSRRRAHGRRASASCACPTRCRRAC